MKGRYLETPDMISSVLDSFMTEEWINLVGGCWQTTPAHIKKLAEVSKKHTPRKMSTVCITYFWY